MSEYKAIGSGKAGKASHNQRSWTMGNLTNKSIIHLVALVMLTAVGAQATIYQWNGTTGNWNDGGNWNPAGPPTAVSGDQTYVKFNGTAVIAVGDSAVSDDLTIEAGSHIIQNGGTLTVSDQLVVAGTYTLNVGLLDHNGGAFALGTGGTFYQNGGEVQAATITMSGAGSLYEISGGTFTGGMWNRSNNDSKIRIIGGAASINVNSLAFRNDGGGASLEFVLDNSATHISMATHTGSGLRRNGHLDAKLNGGVLLSDTSQFNLVRSDSTMASYSWASTPGGLWTYSGNVRDGGTGPYYERITLAAGKGTLNCSLNTATSFTATDYGYLDLTNVDTGKPLDIALELGAGTLGDLTAALDEAGIAWRSSPLGADIVLTLDPSVSGDKYFAWDLSSIAGDLTIKRVWSGAPPPRGTVVSIR